MCHSFFLSIFLFPSSFYHAAWNAHKLSVCLSVSVKRVIYKKDNKVVPTVLYHIKDHSP